MDKDEGLPIYSGASPQQVRSDLLPLVNFQEEGLSIHQLNKLIDHNLLPHLMNYSRPGFQSMFNSFPEEGAELGAKIALTYNQGVTNWQVSPGGAMLEELCCKALCRLFDFPQKADATFMYSGTYANHQALYLALHRKAEQCGFDLCRKGLSGFKDLSNLVVLASRDAHFSIRQAVRLLGLGDQNLILLDLDGNRRIDLQGLSQTLANIGKSKEIFCLVATAGTTSTGSIDPIRPLLPVSQKLGAWLHVDGAYGLAYSLVPEWKDRFAGFEMADSVSWDPHKQFGTPIPNSILFVGDATNFNRIAIYSKYFNREEDPEPNPGTKSPPSTRPFSALPLITSILFQGLKKITTRLQSPLLAIRTLAILLEKEKDFQLSHQPETGILCFRLKPDNFSAEQLDALQRSIYDRIMTEGNRSISITQLDKQTVLRLVAISPTVTIEALVETISTIKALGKEYIKEHQDQHQ